MADSRRTQMTKKLFRTALVELMQEKPYHKITIKEICDRADLNRTTFYLHYEDQNHLLNEIINQIEKNMTEYISASSGEEDRIQRLTKYLEYVKENVAIYCLFMRSDDDGGARTRIITDILSEMRYDLPQLGSPEESAYVYRFVIEGTISMIFRWIDNGFDLSNEELARLIFNLGACIKAEMEALT